MWGSNVRGSWRLNITATFWPPLFWPTALCLSRSPGLLNRRSGGSAFSWVLAFSTTSYQQLLRTPNHQGPRGPIQLGVAFPTTSYQQLISNCLTSVLTELYNSSTPTQSPTRSLEWHVWSSSRGNNCHAVQRSLSSGVSVYECIMGFFVRRCPWCNCYRRGNWTRWLEFKSWTRLIAFHIALITLGKVWIQVFSLQLWVNSRTD